MERNEGLVAAKRVGYERAIVAGYSGTPLPKKLGIKPGQRVALIAPPSDATALLQPLPDDVKLDVDPRSKGPYDVLLLFCRSVAELTRRFDGAKQRLAVDGGLWVCWPKRAAQITTDLNENLVRERGLAEGLVDNKVCAVDDTWSGLRLVYRLKDRAAKRSS
jgi:hypothetical protein